MPVEPVGRARRVPGDGRRPPDLVHLRPIVSTRPLRHPRHIHARPGRLERGVGEHLCRRAGRILYPAPAARSRAFASVATARRHPRYLAVSWSVRVPAGPRHRDPNFKVPSPWSGPSCTSVCVSGRARRPSALMRRMWRAEGRTCAPSASTHRRAVSPGARRLGGRVPGRAPSAGREATPLEPGPGGVLALVLLVAVCVPRVAAWLVQRRADPNQGGGGAAPCGLSPLRAPVRRG